MQRNSNKPSRYKSTSTLLLDKKQIKRHTSQVSQLPWRFSQLIARFRLDDIVFLYNFTHFLWQLENSLKEPIKNVITVFLKIVFYNICFYKGNASQNLSFNKCIVWF